MASSCKRWFRKCLHRSPHCALLVDCQGRSFDVTSTSGRTEQTVRRRVVSTAPPLPSPGIESLVQATNPELPFDEEDHTGIRSLSKVSSHISAGSDPGYEGPESRKDIAMRGEHSTEENSDDDGNIDSVSQTVPELLPETEEETIENNAVHGSEFEATRCKKDFTAGYDWAVLPYQFLPRWMQGNEFLLNGYRPPLNSYKKCFKSVFRIHTETGNIWTHLIGCIVFVVMAVVFSLSAQYELEWEDKLAFAAFFIGAISCFGLSTLFHTCNCHSYKVDKLFSKLDYCGISFNTVGSFIPWLYYSFYCGKVKLVYLGVILALGSVCLLVSMRDTFSEDHLRWLRASLFAALGSTGVVPALHSIIANGFVHMVTFGGFRFLFIGSFFYLFGVIIYAVRIPERLRPGQFDILFQSHQIFHVSSTIGALLHFYGMTVTASNNWLRGCSTNLELSLYSG